MAHRRCTSALTTAGYYVMVGDVLSSTHDLVVRYPEFFESAGIPEHLPTATIAVTVPAITDPDIASVDVDISSAALSVAVGDGIEAIPLEAMETNCRFLNAYVIGADSVRCVFGSLGGNVTGSAKNFKFFVSKLV